MVNFQGAPRAFVYLARLPLAMLLVGCTLGAQTPAPSESPSVPVPVHEDKRAYGVLPNYRTAEAALPFAPITAKQKWMIGVKDSFDGASYPLAGFFAGIAQLNDTNPSFGQGAKGYAHRYATAFGDQVSGNLLTESLLPIALHEDPRFFRKGSGSIKGRIWYAATRVLVCKTDGGTPTFNIAEVLGNGMAGAIGNAYYPDSRGAGPTFQRMFTAIGTDSISNVLKEFWPDVKNRYLHKKHDKLDSGKTAPSTGE